MSETMTYKGYACPAEYDDDRGFSEGSRGFGMGWVSMANRWTARRRTFGAGA